MSPSLTQLLKSYAALNRVDCERVSRHEAIGSRPMNRASTNVVKTFTDHDAPVVIAARTMASTVAFRPSGMRTERIPSGSIPDGVAIFVGIEDP